MPGPCVAQEKSQYWLCLPVTGPATASEGLSQGGLLEGVRMASRVVSGLKYHLSLKGKPQKREDLEIKIL